MLMSLTAIIKRKTTEPNFSSRRNFSLRTENVLLETRIGLSAYVVRSGSAVRQQIAIDDTAVSEIGQLGAEAEKHRLFIFWPRSVAFPNGWLLRWCKNAL
jgi:hypothetical protein